MTDEKYTKEFQKALNDYIKLGFNQDECNGFMHGFHKGAEAQQLIIADVSQQRELCEGNCGMSYCDENGCVNKKQILCEPKPPEHCG